eukprot:1007735-Pelagomonas_calceolata.AAC.1
MQTSSSSARTRRSAEEEAKRKCKAGRPNKSEAHLRPSSSSKGGLQPKGSGASRHASKRARTSRVVPARGREREESREEEGSEENEDGDEDSSESEQEGGSSEEDGSESEEGDGSGDEESEEGSGSTE